MKELEKYMIRKLIPELLDDYLGYFDNDAFADNPSWGYCYCRFHHFPHKERKWGMTTAEENRAAVTDLILSGTLKGHLVYLNDKPVGWCNAGPRREMTTMPDYDEPDADRIGSIVCFIISKNHRRKGIARQLLQAACEGFKSQGFTIAEAYVLKGARGDAMNYPGPLSMYLSAGFEPFRECCCDGDDTIVLRRNLV